MFTEIHFSHIEAYISCRVIDTKVANSRIINAKDKTKSPRIFHSIISTFGVDWLRWYKMNIRTLNINEARLLLLLEQNFTPA